MRIATNVTREYLGGITRSNVNFMDSLHGKGKGVIGLELNARRYVLAPTIFNHLSTDWFHHHIINIHDLPISRIIEDSKTLKEVETAYRPVIAMIKEILKKEKPDIMFLNGTYYIPWLFSIAAYELKIPIVLRYAGVYSKETEHAKPKDKKFFNEIEKSFQKRVNYFIFPSRLCQEMVEKEVLHKKVKHAFIVPNAFSIPEQAPIFKSVERRIAAVGRWDRIKNFKEFFRIHKALQKEKWLHEATFVTSDSKIKNMPKTINRLASMTHDELINFYSAQGLLISPSIFETFGNVPMEAVCMGVPVLVSENMGCAEILKNAGLESMVISFDNPKEVIERVKKLCGQQIMPKQINNLRKILNPQVINAQIMSILRNAVNNAK